MNILAIDTSGEPLSLALSAGEKIWRIRRAPKRPHDETLVPAVEGLLKKAGLGFKDLGAVAAAAGPGRFTGIRIGMSFAAVAAGRLKIPALAVSRLEALAWTVPGHAGTRARSVCALLPGFRDEKFYQLFLVSRGGVPRPKAPPAWATAAEWEKIRKEFEAADVLILEGEVGAEELLAPARAALKLRRRRPFQPLYLKSAKYESAPRVLR